MILFGAGKLIAVPKFDAYGVAIAVPTPVVVGVLQEVSVDISYESKTLHGAAQFPVAVGRGKGTISWKAKSGDFKGAVLGQLFLGIQGKTQRNGMVVDEPVAVPSATPYELTAAPPATGTFVQDMGLVNVTTGKPLKRVLDTPTAGQYVVGSDGKYTFAAADAGLALMRTYEYKATGIGAEGSELFEINNETMGYAPTFSALFYNKYAGKTQVLKLHSNNIAKLALPFKNDDFTLHDVDAEAFANDAAQVGYFCHY